MKDLQSLLNIARDLETKLSNLDVTLDKDYKQELYELVTSLWDEYLRLTENAYQTDFMFPLFNAQSLEQHHLEGLNTKILSIISKKTLELELLQQVYTSTKKKNPEAKILKKKINKLIAHIKSLNISFRKLKKMQRLLTRPDSKYIKHSVITFSFMAAGGLIGAIGQTLSAPFYGIGKFFSTIFGPTDDKLIPYDLDYSLWRLIVASIAMPIEILSRLLDPTTAISKAEMGRLLADPFYNSLKSLKILISLIEPADAKTTTWDSSLHMMSELDLQILELYLITGIKLPSICKEIIADTTDFSFQKISAMGLEANIAIILQLIPMISSMEEQAEKETNIQLVQDLLAHTISTKLDDGYSSNTYKSLLKSIDWINLNLPGKNSELLQQNITSCKIYLMLADLKKQTDFIQFKLKLSEFNTLDASNLKSNHIEIILLGFKNIEQPLTAANKVEWITALKKFIDNKPELNQITVRQRPE